EAALPGHAGVLRAAKDHVLDVVIVCRVELRDLEIAIEAAPRVEDEPLAEPEDATVVGFDNVAVCVERHVTRVGVRRREQGAERVGDVVPASTGSIATENVADERRGCLPIPADVNEIRVTGVGDDGEVVETLAARMNGGRRADHGPVSALICGAEYLGYNAHVVHQSPLNS